MNILIFIPEVVQSNGGVRQYSVSLLKILSNDNINKYFIVHNVSDQLIMGVIKDAQNMYLVPIRFGTERKIEKILRLFFDGMNYIFLKAKMKTRISRYCYLDRLCKKYKIDIAYCPYQDCPPTTRVKTICTMHDMQELHFPEYFTPEERAERAIGYNDTMKRSDAIIVSYNHIKQDIYNYFPSYFQKTRVCLLDMSQLWFNGFQISEISDNIKNIIPDKFLLYPANTWKHKNHISLIIAIAQIRDIQKININVVCTGNKNENFYYTIKPLLDKLKLNDIFLFTGLVSAQDLFNLYHKAIGVVVPTKYEAGSYPVMESMILNIPVICSNVTSLPETINNPLFVFDPNSIDDIASKCLKLYNDEVFRNLSIANSKINAPIFQNTNALREITNIFRELP